MLPRAQLAALALLVASGCSADPVAPAPTTSAPSAVTSSAPAPPAPRARRPAPVREGGALVRSVGEDMLYLADEDHRVVRCIPLPVDVQKPPIAVELPGAPAQVLALDGLVLVTVRDPGMLLLMRPDPTVGLIEAARVALPADAWGIALAPDERMALVSSAWTHQISAVDLPTATRKWSLDVPREPRAIVIRPEGTSAYVTHLTGAALSRIDHLDGEPTRRAVALRPAPDSAPLVGKRDSYELDATLAYSAVLSPDAQQLFVPRHALGAQGANAWFGRSTIDILLTGDDSTLIPDRKVVGLAFQDSLKDIDAMPDGDAKESAEGPVPIQWTQPFPQPRAIAYRRRTRTLLVASEGADRLAELDALALDPALNLLHSYELAGPFSGDPAPGEDRLSHCGAPTGLALSADESYAWVHCRSTGDLAVVRLEALDGKPSTPSPMPIVHIVDDPLPEKAAHGRRSFYNAWDSVLSGGLGCAGCHPEGRDDGHVWQEQPNESDPEGKKPGGMTAAPVRDGSIWNGEHGKVLHKGYPRQTPMLAGRVAARGPWGWHGKQQIIEQRIITGFNIHGGGGGWGTPAKDLVRRAEELAAFLRQGLVTPPRERRPLSAVEEKGREIFMSSETRCSTCHFPATDYSDRSVVSLGIPPVLPTFIDEPKQRLYKTPSLLFVGGTAPYFHDGRFATLEELLEKNRDRMGRTSQLGSDDRAALAAFLHTVGTVDPEASPDPAPAAKAPATPPALPPLAPAEPPSLPAWIEVEPPPAEVSLRPTWPEWNKAPALPLPRPHKACKLFRVREWVRAHCEIDMLVQTTMIVGSREGVEISQGRHGGGGDIVFPLRRGDARIFEFDELTGHYKMSSTWNRAAVVTERWLEGDAAPVITLN